jgi:phosphatidylinositol alpha-mannosyltransferase
VAAALVGDHRAVLGSVRHPRRLGVVAALVIGAILGVVAIGGLDVGRVLDSLVGLKPGWVALASTLMALSLGLRALSWRFVLRAALPDRAVPTASVMRATMIGVMASAVLPGRLGEPVRAVIVARRLGSVRGSVSLVAGTIVSQTLLNLVALVVLGAAVIAATGLLSPGLGALIGIGAPVAIAALTVAGPGLLVRMSRHGPPRLRTAVGRVALELGRIRTGLRVFRRPRPWLLAALPQFAAWGLQVASCYAVLCALDLQGGAGWTAAAAVLVAVNVTAVVPVAPSNVGVFQVACVAVLSGFSVSRSDALAYGIVLQLIEVVTAVVLGLLALAGEGLSWNQLRDAGGTRPTE